MKLVQCVPNFSEGRDPVKVKAIVSAIRSALGVVILDEEMDKDHHRSVITFVGPPQAAAEGAFLGAQKALELIDMTKHKGEHPRMGATDVIPLTPIFGVTIEECVALAKALGERLAKELKIPVYLYAFAALRPERSNLAVVRKGEFEGIRELMGKDPSRDPDFGGPRIHPTAGATAVGAREHIINFNVNLDSQDMALGKEIARKIRASGGGHPYLRAKEIDLSSQGKVQISTVLENFRVTDLNKVYESVGAMTSARGIDIAETELVGLVPARALEDSAIKELKVKGFDPEAQVLEAKILNLLVERASGAPSPVPFPLGRGQGEGHEVDWLIGLRKFCEALARPDPVPGGGSASAGMAAIGVSLALKVFRIQAKKNAAQSINGQTAIQIEELLRKLAVWKTEFEKLADQDAEAYRSVAQAYKMLKTDPARAETIQSALKKAADVPLKTLRLAAEAFTFLWDRRNLISASLESDLKVGFQALMAGASGAKANVLINLFSIKDETYKNKAAAQAEALEKSLKDR